MLPFLAIIYLIQQFSFFSAVPANPDRPVDHVKIGAWVVLSLVLLAALTTKGFWLHSREVRDMIDDEGTRAHRVAALGWGFVMAILSAITLFFLSMFEPISAREAIHVIVSLGIAAAIIRFAMLERRAMRDA
jgi:hypothetical protein